MIEQSIQADEEGWSWRPCGDCGAYILDGKCDCASWCVECEATRVALTNVPPPGQRGPRFGATCAGCAAGLVNIALVDAGFALLEGAA